MRNRKRRETSLPQLLRRRAFRSKGVKGDEVKIKELKRCAPFAGIISRSTVAEGAHLIRMARENTGMATVTALDPIEGQGLDSLRGLCRPPAAMSSIRRPRSWRRWPTFQIRVSFLDQGWPLHCKRGSSRTDKLTTQRQPG